MAQQNEINHRLNLNLEEEILRAHFSLITALGNYLEILLATHNASELQHFFQEKLNTIATCTSVKEMSIKIFSLDADKPTHNDYPALTKYAALEHRLRPQKAHGLLVDLKLEFVEQLKKCCQRKLDAQLELQRGKIEEARKKMAETEALLAAKKNQLKECTLENAREEFKKLLKTHLSIPFVLKSDDIRQALAKQKTLKNLLNYLLKFHTDQDLMPLTNFIQNVYLEFDEKAFNEQILPIIDEITKKPDIIANKADSTIREISGNHILLEELFKKNPSLLTDNGIEEIRITATGTLFLNADYIKLASKNLILVAPRTQLLKPIVIDTSGKDADASYTPGTSAKDGKDRRAFHNEASSSDGMPGQHGNAGYSAGNVYIETHELIGTNLHQLTLKLNGGKGEDGQRGGNGDSGTKGTDGKRGVPEETPSHFTRGSSLGQAGPNTAGKQGGNGGPGGLGGQGGLAGKAKIKVGNITHEIDSSSQTTSLEFKVECKNGEDGKRGDSGEGGEGGTHGKEGVDHGIAWRGYVFGINKIEALGRLIKETIYPSFFSRTPPAKFKVIKTEDEINNTDPGTAPRGNKLEITSLDIADQKTSKAIVFKSQMFQHLQQSSKHTSPTQNSKKQEIAQLESEIGNINQQQSLLKEQAKQLELQQDQMNAFKENLENLIQSVTEIITTRQNTTEIATTLLAPFKEEAENKNHASFRMHWTKGHIYQYQNIPNIKQLIQQFLDEFIVQTRGWFSLTKPTTVKLEEKLSNYWTYLTKIRNVSEREANTIIELMETCIVVFKKQLAKNDPLLSALTEYIKKIDTENQNNLIKPLQEIITAFHKQPQQDVMLKTLFYKLLNDEKLDAKETESLSNVANMAYMYNFLIETCDKITPGAAVSLLQKAISVDSLQTPNNMLSRFVTQYSAASATMFSWKTKIDELHNKCKLLETENTNNPKNAKIAIDFTIEQTTLYRHFFNHTYSSNDFPFDEALTEFNSNKNAHNLMTLFHRFIDICEGAIKESKNVYQCHNQNIIEFLTTFQKNMLSTKFTESELNELTKSTQRFIVTCQTYPKLFNPFYHFILHISQIAQHQLLIAKENNQLIDQFVSKISKESDITLSTHDINNIRAYLESLDHLSTADRTNKKTIFIEKITKAYNKNTDLANFLLQKTELVNEASIKLFLSELDQNNGALGKEITDLLHALNNSLESINSSTNGDFAKLLQGLVSHQNDIRHVASFQSFISTLLYYFEFTSFSTDELKEICKLTAISNHPSATKQTNHAMQENETSWQQRFFMLAKTKYKENILKILDANSAVNLTEQLESCLEEIDTLIENHPHKSAEQIRLSSYETIEQLCDAYQTKRLNDSQATDYLRHFISDTEICLNAIHGPLPALLIELIKSLDESCGKKGSITLQSFRLQMFDLKSLEQIINTLKEIKDELTEEENSHYFQLLQMLEDIARNKIKPHIIKKISDKIHSSKSSEVITEDDVIPIVNYIFEHIDEIVEFLNSSNKIWTANHPYASLTTIFDKLNSDSKCDFRAAYLFELSNIPWNSKHTCLETIQNFITQHQSKEPKTVANKLRFLLQHFVITSEIGEELMKIIINSSLPFDNVKELLEIINNNYYHAALRPLIQKINSQMNTILTNTTENNKETQFEDKAEAMTDTLHELLSNYDQLNFEQQSLFFAKFSDMIKNTNFKIEDANQFKANLIKACFSIKPVTIPQTINGLINQYTANTTKETTLLLLEKCIELLPSATPQELLSLEQTTIKCLKQLQHFDLTTSDCDKLKAKCLTLQTQLKNAHKLKNQVFVIERKISDAVNHLAKNTLFKIIDRRELQQQKLSKDLKASKIKALEKVNMDIECCQEAYEHQSTLTSICASLEKMQFFLSSNHADDYGDAHKTVYIQISNDYDTLRQQGKFVLKNIITQLETKVAERCKIACIQAVLPKLIIPQPADDETYHLYTALLNDIQLSHLIAFFKHIYTMPTFPHRGHNLKILATAFTGIMTTNAMPDQKTANDFHKYLEMELLDQKNQSLLTDNIRQQLQVVKHSLKSLMIVVADEALNNTLIEMKNRENATQKKIKNCHHQFKNVIEQVQQQIRQLEQEMHVTIPLAPLLNDLKSNVIDKIDQLSPTQIDEKCQKSVQAFWLHSVSVLMTTIQSKHPHLPKLSPITSLCSIKSFCDLTKQWCNHLANNNGAVLKRDRVWIRGMLTYLSFNLISLIQNNHASQLQTLFKDLITTLDVISNNADCAMLANCLPDLAVMVHQIFLSKINNLLTPSTDADPTTKHTLKMMANKITDLITAAPTIKEGYNIANQLLDTAASLQKQHAVKSITLKEFNEKFNDELAMSVNKILTMSALKPEGKQLSDKLCHQLSLIKKCFDKSIPQSNLIINNELRVALNTVNLINLPKASYEVVLTQLESISASMEQYDDEAQQVYAIDEQQRKLFDDTVISLKEKIYGHLECEFNDHEKALFKRILAANYQKLNFTMLKPSANKASLDNAVYDWLMCSDHVIVNEENLTPSIKTAYDDLLKTPSTEALSAFKEQFVALFTPLLTPTENTFFLQIMHNLSNAKQFQPIFNIFQLTPPESWSYHLQQLALNMTHQTILSTAHYNYSLMEKLFNEVKKQTRKLNISASEWNKVEKQLWRLFNQYEHDEQEAHFIINFLNSLSEKITANSVLTEQLTRLKKHIQKAAKVKNHVNKAMFFAEEGDYLAQLFNLINTGIHKNTSPLLSQVRDEMFLDLISDIAFECEDRKTTEKALAIIQYSQPNHWKEKIYLYRFNETIDNFFSAINENSNIQRYRDEITPPINKFKHNLPLIKLLTSKLSQENQLMDARSKITPHSLISTLQLLNNTTINHNLLNTLEGKSLSQWKQQLRLNTFANILVATDSESTIKRTQCIAFLGQLEKRYGEILIDQLCRKLEKLKIDYSVLTDVLDYFVRSEYLFDKEAIDKIATAPFTKWKTILKTHTNSTRQKERKIEDLLNLLKVEPAKDKPNEATQYTKDLLIYLNDKVDKTKAMLNSPAPLENFSSLPVKQWDATLIKAWACALKAKSKEWIKDHIAHVIAVISRAIVLSKLAGGYYPRDTQLLALWVFIEAAQNNKGRLGQISTGEGKTVITAMFATLKALAGEKVDVITSSSVLAERDAKANHAFFDMFNLTVANNCDEECIKKTSVRRTRYKANIVYGDVGSFQRDILLNDFHAQPILGDRKETTLLVDEVDSMLIDKSENMLYLSHDIADLRHLRHVYIKIWELVNAANIDQYSRAERIDLVADHVNRAIANKLICIPAGLKEFVEQRLRTWIKSAFTAKNMKPNGHYITSTKHNKSQKNKTIVMDNDTGVEQLQTQWSNGLHQFLQLKHTQEISDESLKAVFISNMSYFKRYTNKIYGLTGTLGSSADRALLKQMYQVDFFQLPRYKANLFVEKTAIVTLSEHTPKDSSKKSSYSSEQISSNGWFEAIENEIKQTTEGEKARAILVICEDVDHVAKLVEHMKKTCPNKKLHVYDTAYEKFEIGQSHKTAVKPGDIIIATNLAGRGTDLHTSDDLEKHGGLHVVLSYLPPNTRIEEQAFGRTARQGKHGSGRYIVLSKNNPQSIEELKATRDETEQNNIDKIRMQNLESISLEETLFESFKKLHHEIRVELDSKYKLSHGKDYIDIQLKSLSDHWAFWLDSMSDKIKTAATAEDKKRLIEEFKPFEKSMLSLLRQNTIFKLVTSNHELIKLGHFFLSTQRAKLALQCYEKVITTDKEFAEIAYYYKAYAISQNNGLSELKHRKAHFKHLAKARKLIKRRIDEVTASNEIVNTIAIARKAQGHAGYHNEYQEQACHEITLLNVHLRAIDDAIGSEISEESFTQDPKLKDKEKSKKIFHALRSNPKIFKDYRISKKVTYNQEQKSLVVNDNGNAVQVDIPREYAYCKTEIFAHLNKIIETKNAVATDRAVNETSFSPYVVSKAQLWELLEKNGLLHKENDMWMIFNPDQALKKLDISTLGEHGKIFHDILCLNLHKKFEKALFPHIDDQTFEQMTNILKEQKIIKNVACAKLTLKYDTNKQSIILPPPLEKFRTLLGDLVKLDTSAGTIPHTITHHINIEELPLRDSQEEASRALWNYLITQDVIKPCAINFQLALAASSSKIDAKLNIIEKQLKKEITKLYGKEGDEFCEPILNILKRATGKLKTIEKLNVNFQNLDQFFLKGDYPPELETFTKIIFDKVLCFEEKPTYWNWHAFAVAMFGLAQIITGVLLEVFSVGASTPISAILISEGIGDIVFAIHSGLTNSFSWKQYGIHKLTSVVCTSLTLGIFPPAIVNVPMAATSTLMGFFRYTSIRILQESIKAVGFGLIGFALDKVVSILPYELSTNLGKFIKEKLLNSSNIKTAVQQLKDTMAQLLSLSNISDTIKQEIQVEMLEILNPSQTWIQTMLIVAEGVAKQLPDSILCAKSQSLKGAVGMTGAILIEETIKLSLQAMWASGKCYLLIDEFEKNINKLTENLNSKIEKHKKQYPQASTNPTTPADQQFINHFVDTQHEELVNLITKTLSDEVAKPLVSRTVFRAVNHLTEYWNDFCQKAAGVDNTEEAQMRTLRNRQQMDDDGAENQKPARRAPQRDQDIDDTPNEIVNIDDVDPATEISNADGKTLKDVIESSGKDNIKLYKNINGELVMQESSTQKLIAGQKNEQKKYSYRKGEDKPHQKRHHGGNKKHGKDIGQMQEKVKHKIDQIEQKSQQGRNADHHHRGDHSSYASSTAKDKYRGSHHSGARGRHRESSARSHDMRRSDFNGDKMRQPGSGFGNRNFRNRNQPLRRFAVRQQNGIDHYMRTLPIGNHVSGNNVAQFFSRQTLNMVCNLAKVTCNIAGEQINQYYQHRIRAIKIEMLKDKIASYHKLKQLHEKNKQEDSTFIAQQKIKELEHIETRLKQELKKKEDEISLQQAKITELMLNKIKTLQSNASNDDESLKLIESELRAIKALNEHAPCGGQNIAQFNESIAAIFKNLSTELARIDPIKIKALQQLSEEIKPLEKNQSDLEEQLNIVLSAQKIKESGNIDELENFILKNKIPVKFQQFLPTRKPIKHDIDKPNFDANDFITQSNLMAGANYQLSSLCKSNMDGISSLVNVFESACKIVETKFKYDAAMTNIQSKQTERSIEQINASSTFITETLKSTAIQNKNKDLAEQRALSRSHEIKINAEHAEQNKEDLDDQLHINQKRGELHAKRLQREHADQLDLIFFKQSLEKMQADKLDKPNDTSTNSHNTNHLPLNSR